MKYFCTLLICQGEVHHMKRKWKGKGWKVMSVFRGFFLIVTQLYFCKVCKPLFLLMHHLVVFFVYLFFFIVVVLVCDSVFLFKLAIKKWKTEQITRIRMKNHRRFVQNRNHSHNLFQRYDQQTNTFWGTV